ADIVNASRPVRVVGMRLNGVTQDVANHLAQQSLMSAHVAVRAYSLAGIEVIRDEAGNVEFTDNTGAPGMPGNWFARRAGEPNGGYDAAARGARRLIEEEIMAKPLIGNAAVRTDSEK